MSFYEKFLFSRPTYPMWKKVGIFAHHGICTPLSSLKSEKSEGIGDFYDGMLFVDWLVTLKMDLFQLLPLNDTGFDLSPYNAQSSCALDPVYLRLSELEQILDSPLKKEIESLQKAKTLSFFEVRKKKLQILKKYVSLFFSAGNSDYELFLQNNPWVMEYALYKSLRQRFQEAPWESWPKNYQNPQEPEVFTWIKEEQEALDFYSFVQYLCFTQLRKLKQYALEKKILLMGDIPILVSRDSADVWFHRKVFCLGVSAGAPPDLYNPQGQAWGFPIFDWDYLQKNHYYWWERRLQVASGFYDIYRIDHLVGFFRIWAIEQGKKASQGKFISPNRALWSFEGKHRLETLLSLSQMLPIAEDLGTIPLEVRPTLKELGIPGTIIPRWYKRWEEDQDYILGKEYPFLSSCSLSTHDSETLLEWWEKFPLEAKQYAQSRNLVYTQELSFSARKALLQEAHESASLFHINLLSEYLALFPELVEQEGRKDRINIPGTSSSSNWSYRMKPPIEKLLSHKNLGQVIREIRGKSS